MNGETSGEFRIGAWQVEPRRHRLRRNGEERRVTPKTMELLLRLADRPGDVVTRDELLASIWPDTHTGEEVLTRVVSDLRAALGDDRKSPQFVETIPKVGYRLIAEVGEVGGVGPVAEVRTIPGRRVTLVTLAIAVLVVGVGYWIAVRDGGFGSRDAARPAAPLAAVPLTTDRGFESHAEVSPDGSRVAYVWSGNDGSNADIWMLTIATGERKKLTDHPAFEAGATWAPDGRRVAFHRYQEDSCTIVELPVDGGPERRIGSCGRSPVPDLAWSPDGEWLAFSDRDDPQESFGVFLLSTVTGERRKLIGPPGQAWGDRDPSFSPDGRQVAFTRSVSMATQDVWRIPVEGGEALPVTRDGRSVRGHAWAPDGASIVVSTRRTAWRGLWRYPLDGGDPRWIPLEVSHAWRPSIARDGAMVFESRKIQVGLSRLSLARGSPTVLESFLPSTAEDLDPDYSPDGSRIAFTSNRSGFFEIWIAGGDGSDPEQLTALGGSFTGNARWSPDGRRIAFDARVDGQADVWIVDVERRQPRRLTSDPGNDLAPSFSADGKTLYFGSNRSDGRWQIWRMPAEGGAAEPVTDDGGYLALESADGTTLFYTKYGDGGLFRRSTSPGDGAGETAVAFSENLIGPEHWTVAGDGLYLITADDDRVQLIRMRDGQPPETLHEATSTNLMAGLAIAPDGSGALVASITRIEADLWRVDLE